MAETSPATPARRAKEARSLCAVCGKEFPRSRLVALATVRPAIVERMRRDHPDFPEDGYMCGADVARYRAEYVAELLRSERGELGKLEEDVVRSLSAEETLSENVEASYSEQWTFGEQVADRVATFGGSWTFILTFLGLLCVWMAVNVVALLREPFDPYPFILLNLVLSCIAALQAPVIMMSQRRQEAKDRLRSENDYKINLKAELEIRHLHEKMDHLINRQWERLAEIQEIQLEMMQDAVNRRPG